MQNDKNINLYTALFNFYVILIIERHCAGSAFGSARTNTRTMGHLPQTCVTESVSKQ